MDDTHNNVSQRVRDLAADHTPTAVAKRLQQNRSHSHLGDFVLGAIDGTVTTFAIVAGAAGANLSPGVALVMGLANVLADAFSMAVSNYLKARSEQHALDAFRRMEEDHVRTVPDGEREEIRQIFAAKGFDGQLLETIVEVITSDRRRWVDTMLREELGLSLDCPSPGKAAGTTFFAFVAAGMVPLMPLIIARWAGGFNVFAASALATAATFALVGYVRGKFTAASPWLASLETLLMGGAAALLAYAVGAMLRGLLA